MTGQLLKFTITITPLHLVLAALGIPLTRFLWITAGAAARGLANRNQPDPEPVGERAHQPASRTDRLRGTGVL